MELPLSISHPSKKKPKNLESTFYQALKRNQKKHRPDVHFTRLESWASQGVPDLVVCSETGRFSFWELKTTSGNAVALSPHQISWLTQHQHAPAFVLVRTSSDEIHVYAAAQAVELRERGLMVEPLSSFKTPFDWSSLFGLTIAV